MLSSVDPLDEAAQLCAQIRQEHELKEQAKRDRLPSWFVKRRRRQIAACYHQLVGLIGEPASQQFLYEVFRGQPANMSPH